MGTSGCMNSAVPLSSDWGLLHNKCYSPHSHPAFQELRAFSSHWTPAPPRGESWNGCQESHRGGREGNSAHSFAVPQTDPSPHLSRCVTLGSQLRISAPHTPIRDIRGMNLYLSGPQNSAWHSAGTSINASPCRHFALFYRIGSDLSGMVR